ncbi:MAG: 3-dehydroquinate synthase [Burkholderiales bacterium]|nr:3-dehydroquinate synthase [Burkholderiales bacterium]
MTSSLEPRVLAVGLGERSYPIRIGNGVLAEAGSMAAALGARRAIVVTNPVVAGHWLAPVTTSLTARGIATATIEIPDGEAHKDFATLESLLTRLLEHQAERKTLLVALGGGVVGDLAGFAAAIYQRGMPFIQIPTTLLSQVDSSVGGKTGINHPLGKNMIGAFHQPRAVLIDTACLATLPPRELAAGVAEVVKYGAIRDLAFFAWLEANLDALRRGDPAALAQAIEVSCRIKAEIVAADEREEGERALLNFGHTFGHAIENAMGYGEWLHGEAVATGMVVAAQVSARLGMLPATDVDRLRDLLARAALPVTPPALGYERWMSLMARDKKVTAGTIRFVLLEALGRAVAGQDVSADVLRDVLP